MNRQRIARLALLLLVSLLVAACNSESTDQTLSEAIQEFAAQGEAAQSEEGSAAGAPGDAIATVNVPSLRVRAAPSSAADVVFGIKEGQQYGVIGLSSDGEWVQLAIPSAPEGEGWVSSNFVNVEGSITNAAVVKVTSAPSVAAAGTLPTATPVTPVDTAPVSPLFPAGEPGTATVNTEGVRLRVRAAPVADAEIVGYIYGGENYPVLETSSDGAWVKIDGRSGTDNLNGGWVSTEFLLLY